MVGPWNANIHYDGRLDACVPASATSVLDVGCGDGFLAALLARRVPLVVAIDADAPVLGRARARFLDARVTWCHGDVLTHPLGRESFDAVVSNATRDWPWALTALACRGVANRVRGKWEHTAPQMWPPPDTLRQLRRSLREALPGARISRLLMGRYLIVWRAPG
jgi:SAM-dependent methyltransferase